MITCDDLIICKICRRIEDFRLMNGAQPKYLHIDTKQLMKLRNTIEYEQENFAIEEFGFPNETLFGLTIVEHEQPILTCSDEVEI